MLYLTEPSKRKKHMKIAIASGKGGTGKTTVATNLATIASSAGSDVALLDCDVEEPNCHIFVQPQIRITAPVTVPIPKVDNEKCTGCGKCGEVCKYSAIVCLKGKVLVFPELCHGCGGCELFCPAEAISEEKREVGVVEVGQAKGSKFKFVQGRLRFGDGTFEGVKIDDNKVNRLPVHIFQLVSIHLCVSSQDASMNSRV